MNKAFLCSLLVLCWLSGSALSASSSQSSLDSSFTAFQQWAQKHGRLYDSVEQLSHAFQNFQNNAQRVVALRDQHLKETGESGEFVYALTKFADLSAEEFKARYLGFRPRTQPAPAPLQAVDWVRVRSVLQNSTSFDWRAEGAVTPVKDQGQCGSCWAFSATEEIESMFFLKNKTLRQLAVQQIVSCDTVDGGCNGGDTITAYQYVQKAKGLEPSSVYPYSSGNGDTGTCHFQAKDIIVDISGYSYATKPCTDSCASQDEKTLLANMVATGPVSVCVDAETWQLYNSGVLKSNCPRAYSDLDHCVQLVGFNAEGSTPYWIVRNSWNTDWGVDGYIYIEMNKNLCGIADEATFATI